MSARKYHPLIECHPDVMMDDCHIDLIRALVLAAKPQRILEIGVGSGVVTAALLDAIHENGSGSLTLVDGFNDWNFQKPAGMNQLPTQVEFIQSLEQDFVRKSVLENRQFDFVVSDADHAHTGEWAVDTCSIIAPGGLLIYHDATSEHCPSVATAVLVATTLAFQCLKFNRSSHAHERCERGLAVLQKPL